MILKEKLQAFLKNGEVGFPTALAASVGIVMASPVILTASTGFGLGGSSFVIAMLIACVMMLCQATTFSELASMLPTGSSVYDYISCGMGRFFAVMGTISAYILVHAFAGTAEVILSGIMATVNFPNVQDYLDAKGGAWMVGVGLVLFFAALNYFGVQAFAKVEILLTVAMFATLTIFGFIGLTQPAVAPIEGFVGKSVIGTDLMSTMSLVGMAMFMFLGMELVTPLAPEIRNSHRNIPKAMMLGMLLVLVCMLMWGAGMARQVENVALDPAGTVHILETPDSIPAFANQIMGKAGRIWLGLAFLCAGAACINALMASVSRIIQGMAEDGSLPKVFAKVHPKYRSPVVGIIAAAVIPVAHTIWIGGDLDKILPLVLAAVCAWGFAYLLVTFSLISLRIRRPDLPRAYRVPFYPLPQIISSIGIIVGLYFVAPPTIDPALVYVPFVWMLVLTGIYSFIWVKVVKRESLFTPTPIEEVLERLFKSHEQ
ncbi:Serine/threonine exchanger SteT [Ephemeroptericola cinctiostellae]|uniref:Serine/threonine exchanger SteT n=1 Tax=Ephemeroptericola cinctiostellae TaxID=2268024 RepID=A0A345DCA6_9BURK|nr:APC family permease [Ephemeroptericola cinctiostellae]AXF85994.1 Serine/threonine exchanger SteT [Ephemeroptericola cinctiostellae]